MAEPNDWNSKIIGEFRANGGVVGGMFENMPILLLTMTGAKSGRKRTTPLAYLRDGDRHVIFATMGGAPTNPDWFHNLVANPDATIEVGTETIDVTAEVAQGDERDRLWKEQVNRVPSFGDYEAKTTRTIPVIVLRRRNA
ncbi:MAG: nitroreductase family deazaflavin-dependent oxidoreductase [Actinomycetota bacterium]|nr:nitroreductase family deazaflavin-dependent oxidoreductase [Actinomycetota bacterium]